MALASFNYTIFERSCSCKLVCMYNYEWVLIVMPLSLIVWFCKVGPDILLHNDHLNVFFWLQTSINLKNQFAGIEGYFFDRVGQSKVVIIRLRWTDGSPKQIIVFFGTNSSLLYYFRFQNNTKPYRTGRTIATLSGEIFAFFVKNVRWPMGGVKSRLATFQN